MAHVRLGEERQGGGDFGEGVLRLFLVVLEHRLDPIDGDVVVGAPRPRLVVRSAFGHVWVPLKNGWNGILVIVNESAALRVVDSYASYLLATVVFRLS